MGKVMRCCTKATRSLMVFLCLVAFAGSASAVTTVFTANTVIGSGNTTYDGNDVVVRGCELTVDGSHSFSSLTIQRNPSNVPGVLTQTGSVGICDLNIAQDVLIQGPDGSLVGSRIDICGKGLSSEQGDGAGGSGTIFGGGGGYGGRGSDVFGASGGLTYPMIPALGSGGGRGGSSPGGSGGGAIDLEVTGTLTVNGSILANGGDGQLDGGAGSGGSAWLRVGTLAGSGTILANGGDAPNPNSGGGGGGRIMVIYYTNTFTGTMTAFGGLGGQNGGAGVIVSGQSSGPGSVLVDNGGRSGSLTPLGDFSYCDLTITGGATASAFLGSSNLRSLHIGSAGWLVPSAVMTQIDLTVTEDVVVDAGGSICADGQGHTSGQGSGSGSSYSLGGTLYGTGAGHAGYGGAVYTSPGGMIYGSSYQPTDYGSGGGGGAAISPNAPGGSGGGVIKLTVTGALTVNGSISANGDAAQYPAGGGSGGSVWLSVGTLAGSGEITADGGGASSASGGGGGGRLAVNYTANSFTGAMTAYGGLGAGTGGAGTVYTQGSTQQYGSMLIDNGGNSGALTPFSSTPTIYSLTILGKAVAYPSITIALSSLRVGSGSRLVPGVQYPLDLAISGDAIVDAGGSISADAKGSPSEQGPGHGSRGLSYGTGAGYGGFGGNVGTVSGGIAYGYSNAPTSGSGGGSGLLPSGPMVPGGSGGGLVKLNIMGMLTVNGSISANGDAAAYPAGGGSGGGVWLIATTLAGNGVISANGGAGTFASGGGGGGRVAVYYTTITFSGTTTAYGGSGIMAGGAGTVYTRVSNQTPCVMADNGGLSGAATGIDSYCAGTNLTITGGAIAPMSGSFALASLHVGPGGQLTQVPATTSVLLTVAGDAIVDSGGSIDVTGKGSAGGAGTGKGASGSYYAGGGAYGGAGGAGYGTVGGVPYGSPATGMLIGSGGGNGGNPTQNPGGAGGGCLSLIMTRGNLTVNGIIAADGSGGTGTGGGGSGGGVYLVAAALAGNGVISANGGNAASPYAGGGGGGRVVIRSNTNSFTGPKTAYGGVGYETGAAGTVYSARFSGPPLGGSLVVDNGSRLGALSPLDTMPPVTDLTISGKAAVYLTKLTPLASLHLATGGQILQPADKPGISLAVHEDAVVEAGCSISSDGAAYYAVGPGCGGGTSSYGGGGGYGGRGGEGSDPGAVGGITYGSALKPVDPGSSGGPGGSYLGGRGGGAIKLTVDGGFTLDGLLSANGLTGGYTGGGGSGGSIWVIAGTLSGTGSVSADGGTAASMNAGGGGGGRICLAYADTSSLNVGNVTASGGEGYVYGEDGTVVIDQIEPPVIADIPDHYAVRGMPYSGPTPEVTDDMTGVTTWSLVSGPPDMAYTSVVSWANPVTSGSPYTVTIRATNLVGSTDETWQLTVVDNPKLVPDDGIIRMGDAIVTAAFPGYMYVQPASRLWGIRINQTLYSYVVGNTLVVAGPIKTDLDFERYIEASSTTISGNASCAPIGLPIKSLGGASYHYDQNTGVGQIGVKDGIGLNNIGLLVKTWGHVTDVDPAGAWFVIDDGSGQPTKCIMPDGATADPDWQFATVTGISSCEFSSNDVNRVIRVRTLDDIVPYP